MIMDALLGIIQNLSTTSNAREKIRALLAPLDEEEESM